MRYTDPRPTAVADSECYVNYFSLAFQDVDTGAITLFEKWNDSELDMKGIARMFKKYRVITFNGIVYDMPMIALAMTNATNGELKQASDTIIMSDMKPWQFYDHYNVSLPGWIDHIDLMEVSPGSPQRPSLKLYGGRLHYKTMMDLPYSPDDRITEEKRDTMVRYLGNDLGLTRAKYFELKEGIELRAHMSDEYEVDLRSKSGPQIAESVIKVEVERLTKKRLYKPEARPRTFRYTAPDYISYQTEQLQRMFEIVTNAPFVVNSKLVVEIPPALDDLTIRFGDSVFRMGLGGLHSSESRKTYVTDDEFELIDADVASYYPSLILNGGFSPKHIGEVFMRVFRSIYKRRLKAKKAGDKNTAEALKLTLNGLFGKLGSPYSVVYSPDMMIQTTITGQLAILMLIERLELAGFHVISANTDGFITRVQKSRREEYNVILMDWEFDTMLELEKSFIKGLHSRDVNNFIAIGMDGKVKTKGAFAPAGPGLRGADGMKKNPNCEITIDAVVAFLKNGTPLEQTIRACKDIRKFVTIRTVRGGALDQDGQYLGKAIRWAYGTEHTTGLSYKLTGNAVPKSDGAMPLMTLPDEFPDGIDFKWYVREATAIMEDIGLGAVDPALHGRKGVMLARTGEQKTFHEVLLPVGIARCGKTTESIRDRWDEVESVPHGYRLCAKCRKEGEL